ncbi:MAG: tRNA (adenosine(37)-N6)-dimethylallyltransferase MiaA [Bacteroidota bacterium]|nr:tRNA (adenosine(37)-N6)-dimethylallyltransferase MiaA [Bacteroidota bacterium]
MKKVLAIVGPTASGKTNLAIEAAAILNGEIISADSRQIYKHIPIATSHPAKEDTKKIKHYFINQLMPEEEFTAGQFGKKARLIIDDIFLRGKYPVIAGGSGLYIRSLIDGFFEEEIKSQEIKHELNEKLKLKGKEFLYDELKKIDKDAAKTMNAESTQRVIRALEVFYVSGKKISELQKEKIKINFETIQIGLMLEREYLYDRINKRVGMMIEKGLTDEVRKLKDNGFHYMTYNSLNTVGVKEVFKYFEGEYDYDEMIRMIKQNTRRYAKRQMTWFRKDKRINWISVNEETTSDELVDKILKILNQEL